LIGIIIQVSPPAKVFWQLKVSKPSETGSQHQAKSISLLFLGNSGLVGSWRSPNPERIAGQGYLK